MHTHTQAVDLKKNYVKARDNNEGMRLKFATVLSKTAFALTTAAEHASIHWLNLSPKENSTLQVAFAAVWFK